MEEATGRMLRPQPVAHGSAARPRRADWARSARAMTLLEIMIVAVIVAFLAMAVMALLMSARSLTATEVTHLDLQEQARRALNAMSERLRNAGRFSDVSPARTYPRLFKSSEYPYAEGYDQNNRHAPEHAPKAPPGLTVNGGDPTLESDEIIYRVPRDMDGDGLLTHLNTTTSRQEIEWGPEEHGFFICPGEDGVNRLEFRDSSVTSAQRATDQPVMGEVLARWVDRLQIQDWTTDPTLTSRQLRITLYLTRPLPLKGSLDAGDESTTRQILSISLTTVVDMRNNQFE